MKFLSGMLIGLSLGLCSMWIYAQFEYFDYEDQIDTQTARAEQAWEYNQALVSGGRFLCIYHKELGKCTYHFAPPDKQYYQMVESMLVKQPVRIAKR